MSSAPATEVFDLVANELAQRIQSSAIFDTKSVLDLSFGGEHDQSGFENA